MGRGEREGAVEGRQATLLTRRPPGGERGLARCEYTGLRDGGMGWERRREGEWVDGVS